MTIIQAIIMSIVEGITEFLPISSTGHLVLAATVMGIPQSEFVKSFEIAIQLGAILAVALLYWRRFWNSKHLTFQVGLAVIPSAVLGLIFYSILKKYLIGNPFLIVGSLVGGGIALIVIDRVKVAKNTVLEKVTTREALTIGAYQAVSLIPGVSRSAATIIGGLMSGLDRSDAVLFSFLLAVPTMVLATGLDLVKTGWHFSSNEYLLLAIGLVGSFITALASVKFLLNYVKRHSFAAFGYYRILLALAFLAWYFL